MLLGGPHDLRKALERANALECRDWSRYRYTADSRVLVLRGSEGVREGYLVLAEPGLMRLPNQLRDARFELVSTAQARETGELPDGATLPDGRVVRVYSRGGKFVVTCRELACFLGGQAGVVRRRISADQQLRGADLAGACLRFETFQGMDLRDTDFRGADLRGASFSGAVLIGANLEGACLRGTSFYQSTLREARLRGAEIWDTHFCQTDLTGADLTGLALRNAQLDWGLLLDGARLAGADLRDAYLSGVEARGADLTSANLERALIDGDLRGACLRGANLLGCDLRRAQLEGAVLTGALSDGDTLWPGSTERPGRPNPGPATHAELCSQLAVLDGAILAWHWLRAGLGTFVLKADPPGGSPLVVMFHGAELIDLPRTVTEARIRPATSAELAAARARLGGKWLEQKWAQDPRHLFTITAAQGVFFLWAAVLMPIRPLSEEWPEGERERGPLWEGGPALEELYQETAEE